METPGRAIKPARKGYNAAVHMVDHHAGLQLLAGPYLKTGHKPAHDRQEDNPTASTHSKHHMSQKGGTKDDASQATKHFPLLCTREIIGS